ncbi:hypothetical protein AMELA_G00058890, partial [Ameiurus melas]
ARRRGRSESSSLRVGCRSARTQYLFTGYSCLSPVTEIWRHRWDWHLMRVGADRLTYEPGRRRRTSTVECQACNRGSFRTRDCEGTPAAGMQFCLLDWERLLAKGLTWKIKKTLHKLTAEELFQVVENITPVKDLDSSSVIHGDEESCFDYICTYLNCKTLLDLEDQGFSHLLYLKDAITELIAIHVTEVSQTTALGDDAVTLTPTLTQAVAASQGTVESNITDTFPVDLQAIEYKKLMANYEILGRKLAEFQITQPAQHTYLYCQKATHSRPTTRNHSQNTVYLTM